MFLNINNKEKYRYVKLPLKYSNKVFIYITALVKG